MSPGAQAYLSRHRSLRLCPWSYPACLAPWPWSRSSWSTSSWLRAQLRGSDQAGLREDPRQDSEVHRCSCLCPGASLRMSPHCTRSSRYRMCGRTLHKVPQSPKPGIYKFKTFSNNAKYKTISRLFWMFLLRRAVMFLMRCVKMSTSRSRPQPAVITNTKTISPNIYKLLNWGRLGHNVNVQSS